MATKRGYVLIYICVALGVVTFVYALAASVHLSNKIEEVKAERASEEAKAIDRQTEAIDRQTEAMKDLTKTLKEFIRVMK